MDRILALTLNNHGVVQVGLMKDRQQYKRGVALLVAKAFLPPPHPESFNTPIHLDGDQLNNHISNLMWRPKWFAVKFQRQFKDSWTAFDQPLMEITTQEHFKNSRDLASRYGLLERDIFQSVLHRTYVWPTYQRFRVIGSHHGKISEE